MAGSTRDRRGLVYGEPGGQDRGNKQYLWNENGLLIPEAGRFPDSANGAGFRPLADWVHAQGLKFGIHIVRGIPRQVVKANLPIAGTSFHAVDAADTTSPCPWTKAIGREGQCCGQAYYDSMMKLYAQWAWTSSRLIASATGLIGRRRFGRSRGDPEDRPPSC